MKSEVQSPKSKVQSPDTSDLIVTGAAKKDKPDVGHWTSDIGQPLVPTSEELAVLSPFERFAFRVTHRMNLGAWKRFWTWCQSFFGAGWIHISTYNLMRVYGFEHVEAVDNSRPLLLVAN